MFHQEFDDLRTVRFIVVQSEVLVVGVENILNVRSQLIWQLSDSLSQNGSLEFAVALFLEDLRFCQSRESLLPHPSCSVPCDDQ
jgi:hypothetical protein